MITRAQMRRQLRAQGGIMNVAPREKFGIGSSFQKFKDKVVDRTRKIIPNELADIAVKAAPFVAMIPGYGPAAAGIMRGLGRLDQRGNLTDAMKQGLLTYGGGKLFGAGMEKAGLRDPGASGIGDFFNQGTRDRAGNFFRGGKQPGDVKPPGTSPTPPTGDRSLIQKGTDFLSDKVPGFGKLDQIVQEKLLVGGISAAGSYLYERFLADEPPQDEGETYEQYMARRKENVGRKMRTYMDNYFANDPEYMQLDDAGKDAFVARYNVRDGGRIGYQTGGISMANTLKQNIATNRAQATGIQSMLNAARKKAGLPTVQTMIPMGPITISRMPETPTQPDKMPIGKFPTPPGGDVQPILPVMPGGPADDMKFTKQPVDPAREAFDKVQEKVKEARKINPYTKDVKYGENMTFEEFKKSYDAGTDPNQPTYSGPQLQPTLPGAGAATNLPGSGAPGTEDIMSGYDDFISETYGDGPFIGTMDVRTYRLPDGTIQQGSSTSMGRLNAYLKSIGQPPVTDVNRFIGGDLTDLYKQQVQPGEPGEPGSLSAGISTGGKFTDLQRPREPMMDPNFQNLSPQEQDAAMEKFRKGTDAYIKRFGSFADGREIDPMQGRSSYRDILNAIQTDHPDIYKTLKGDETLAELDQKMLDLQNRKGAAKGGIMSMPMGQPRVNQGGVTELDYRAKGGFVPVGIKEKADDVPAMLSKNEFVFTADAVRGAGNGSIEKGAQKMYDTMKNLERRVT
jgi:hypothetical protein